MKNKEYYAHSFDGKPPEAWHRLEDHLKAVAKMAKEFATDFKAGDWGYLAELWHDIEGNTHLNFTKCFPNY